MTEPHFHVERFRKVFLLILVVAISAGFLAMIRPFLTPLLLAAIFTGLSIPLQRRLSAMLGNRQALASALTILLLLGVVIAPLFSFLGIVASQAGEITQSISPWLQERIAASKTGGLGAQLPLPDFLAPYQTQIYAKLGELTSMVGQFFFSTVTAATRGTATFLLGLFVMLYAMFFFLRDGSQLLSQILYYIPLHTEDELRMVEKFVSVTRATLKGSLVIGILQGALAGGAFAVAGVPAAAFWGTVMAVLSIIPGLGTALIWIPAAGWLYLGNETGAAIGLSIWCIAVVGMVDNIVRPRIVGRDTQMSDLMILLSTLGGLLFFGAPGLLIGPILAGLFVTVWEIYGEAFSAYLPEVDFERGQAESGGQDSEPS
ncbi:MAG: AI-2E family transporter [Myxococcota bacterium]|nr:AI-2E family transporter [Myxococcota bacterium]